jgi:hypothetical protein
MVKQFIYIFLLLAIITMAMYLVYIHYHLAEIEEFTYLGQYTDHGDRVLGTSDMSKMTRVSYANQCNKIAIDKGHPYFGLEYGDECYTGLLKKDNNEFMPLKNTDANGNHLPGVMKRDSVKNGAIRKLSFNNNKQSTLPTSATDNTRVNSGGGWAESIYKSNLNVKFNSSTAPNAITSEVSVKPQAEHFESGTLIEGNTGLSDINVNSFKDQPLPDGVTSGMTIEQIHDKLGFSVSDYDTFIYVLLTIVKLPVKTTVQKIPSPPATNTYGYLKNTDSYGYDLSQPYGEVKYCKTLCDADPNCGGFGYDRRNNANRCFLKDKRIYPAKGGNLQKLDNFDHYWKLDKFDIKYDNNYNVLQNIDAYGYDIRNFQGTFNACKTQCDTNPDCGGFGYYRSRSRCYLKNKDMYPQGESQVLPDFDTYWKPTKVTAKLQDTQPESQPAYLLDFEGYPQFIYHLANVKGIKSAGELYNSLSVNAFTTMEGLTTNLPQTSSLTISSPVEVVDNNIINSASNYNIKLSKNSLSILRQTHPNKGEINKSLGLFQSYGVKNLENWYNFKKKLATIGKIENQSDRDIIQTLRKFGYTTFDTIEENGIDKFTKPYTNFGFNANSPIIDSAGYFQYFLNIGVNKSNFVDFVGSYGLQKFNTKKYKVNASTFFDNSDINSSNPGLYWLMKSIEFYYNRYTFDNFINQINRMGEISQIATASTQEDLKKYVLNITFAKTDDIINKFKIFIKTIKSIDINTFNEYDSFLSYYSNLKIRITNLQIFIVQFRYYYMFLSKGMEIEYTPQAQGATDIEHALVSDFMNPKIATRYSLIKWFLYNISKVDKFNLDENDDFSNLMYKAIQYGWDYKTIATDSPIGNSYTDMVRQGFASMTEVFTSIAESFMGIDPFTTMNVRNEQTELQSFGVIPMNEYNTQMLKLFDTYGIKQWSDIMQYVLRFNKLRIPFNGDPNIPNPKKNVFDAKYNASSTLALFGKFGITTKNEGLDLFDHLLDVVKVPSSEEMFRFINTLYRFGVRYSTYYDFYTWFDYDHLNLVYKMNEWDTNYEIFYMFLGDLMSISNGEVPFDYANGRTNFETLVQNMQSDIFVAYNDIHGNSHKSLVFFGNVLKLNIYPDIFRKIFYIMKSYDGVILGGNYKCNPTLCNHLIDWVTPRVTGDAKSSYQKTLQAYIDTEFNQTPYVKQDGTPTNTPDVFVMPGIFNVFNYETTNSIELQTDKTLSEELKDNPANLTDKPNTFNLAFCIEALAGSEANAMTTCQYNITRTKKLELIDAMLPNMIQYNIDKYNTDPVRSANTIKTYNQNVDTINFLILYPLFAFEIIVGAISNPAGPSLNNPPSSLPNSNYSVYYDPNEDYTFTNNAKAMNKNYNVNGIQNTKRPPVFSSDTLQYSDVSNV